MHMRLALDLILISIGPASAWHTLPKDHDAMLIPITAQRNTGPLKSICHAAAATPGQGSAARLSEQLELMSVAGPTHLQWDVVPKL